MGRCLRLLHRLMVGQRTLTPLFRGFESFHPNQIENQSENAENLIMYTLTDFHI